MHMSDLCVCITTIDMPSPSTSPTIKQLTFFAVHVTHPSEECGAPEPPGAPKLKSPVRRRVLGASSKGLPESHGDLLTKKNEEQRMSRTEHMRHEVSGALRKAGFRMHCQSSGGDCPHVQRIVALSHPQSSRKRGCPSKADKSALGSILR